MAHYGLRALQTPKPCDCGNLAIGRNSTGPVCFRCAEMEKRQIYIGHLTYAKRPPSVEPYRFAAEYGQIRH